jgi:hypothetical protein
MLGSAIGKGTDPLFILFHVFWGGVMLFPFPLPILIDLHFGAHFDTVLIAQWLLNAEFNC